MLFTASVNDTFEPVGCEKATFEYTPMSKVDVQWTYKKGDKIIQMGFMNIAKFRKMLIQQMKENNIEKLTPEFFTELIENAFPPEDDEMIDRDPAKFFTEYFDLERKGYITADEIMKLPSENIKIVLLNSEAPHGPTQIEYPKKEIKQNKNAQETLNDKGSESKDEL